MRRLALALALAAACNPSTSPREPPERTAPARAPATAAPPGAGLGPIGAAADRPSSGHDGGPSLGTPATVAAAGTDPLVSFGGVSRSGGDALTIEADGRIRRERTWPGRAAQVATGRVTRDEVNALRDALLAAGCCALTSEREHGVPDEGHTTLAVRLADRACVVSLWDNEWHQRADAARCAAPLEALAGRAR